MANEVEIQVSGRDAGATQTLTSGAQAATGLGRSVQRVGEIAQGIIAAQMFQQIGEGAARFLGRARDASSNLGESMNAVNVTFEDSAAGIHEIGQTSAQSMGLSTDAFNAAAVRFSAFAEAVAGPGGDVSSTIQDITGRATDFASVMNLDVDQAMQVFQSGLAGESEPLRRYGIDVSAAAVETFAFANGIAEAGTQLSEAQKIQARYGLIMQQTEQMAGDFANTSDSLANSQRIFAAEMENAQAVIGNAMVPGLEALNGVLIPIVQAFTEAPQPIQAVVGSLVLLGGGILTVTSRIAPMIIAMQAAGITMTSLSVKAKGLAASLGPLGVVFAALTFAVVQGTQEFQAADVSADKLAEDLERLAGTGRETGVVTELMGRDLENFGSTLEAVAADAQSNWLDRNFIWSPAKRKEVNQAVEDVQTLDEALVQIVQGGGDGEAALLAYAEANGLTAQEVERLRSFLPGFAEAQERATERTRDAAEAAEELSPHLQAVADAFGLTGDEAEQSAGKIIEAWQEAADDFVDQSQAYQDAAEDLRDDQELTTEKILEELRKQVEAQTNWQSNMVELAGKVPPAIFDELARLGPEGAPLVQQLTEMSAEELDEYIELMERKGRTAGGALISEVQANFVAGAPALAAIAEQEGEEVAEEIADGMRRNGSTVEEEARKVGLAIDRGVGGDRTIGITPVVRPPVGLHNISGIGGQFSAFAAGGITGAQAGGPRGSRVLVGEHRPEVVELPHGSRVIPSVDQALDRGQAGGGVGPTVNVYVQGSILSERELVELLHEELLNGGLRDALAGAMEVQ